MPEMHASEEELILHYYGESAEDSKVESHIDACLHCRAALHDLRHVLELVDAQAVPEPLDGLEQRVWARIQPEVNALRSTWWTRFLAATPRWAFAGGLAAMVLAAFIAGRFTVPETSAPAGGRIATADAAAAAERVMNVAVGDHLDQSQMVLLELLNGGDRQVSNIEDEQDRARDLVAANRLYRHTAVQAGNEGVREVLDALERVLIEIANAPPDVSARELDALRADIEQRGILFHLRVVSSEMRAREQNLMEPSPTGP
jgi:hypothetical protein